MLSVHIELIMSAQN